MRPILFTFKRFVLLAGRAARHVAELVELTPQRIDVLLHLREAPMRQHDLALDMCVCPQVMSRMLRAMEKLLLVIRLRDPSDRRHVIVWWTDVAKVVLHELGEGLHQAFDETDPLTNLQSLSEEWIASTWSPAAAEHKVALRPIAHRLDLRGLVRRMIENIRCTFYITDDTARPEAIPGMVHRRARAARPPYDDPNAEPLPWRPTRKRRDDD